MIYIVKLMNLTQRKSILGIFILNFYLILLHFKIKSNDKNIIKSLIVNRNIISISVFIINAERNI